MTIIRLTLLLPIGQLPLAYVTYEQEHTLKMRDCTADTCYLDDTRVTQSVRVSQGHGLWETVTLTDGTYDGYKLAGVQTVRMEYSADYGWRIAEYVSWVPQE